MQAYTAAGKVSGMDLFIADPMLRFGVSVQEWKKKALPAWKQYMEQEDGLGMHQVPGDHFFMLKEPHVGGFVTQLNKALAERRI